jgi:hypothetical protein
LKNHRSKLFTTASYHPEVEMDSSRIRRTVRLTRSNCHHVNIFDVYRLIVGTILEEQHDAVIHVLEREIKIEHLHLRRQGMGGLAQSRRVSAKNSDVIANGIRNAGLEAAYALLDDGIDDGPLFHSASLSAVHCDCRSTHS